jgi:hypothetical protein
MENDIFCSEIMKEVFYQYCSVCETELDPISEIKAHIARIEKELRLLTLADLVAMIGVKGIIPRDKPSSHVQVLLKDEQGFIPSINKNWVMSCISQRNNEKPGKYFRRNRRHILPITNTYCHLVGTLFAMILQNLLRKYSFGQLPNYDALLLSGVTILEHKAKIVLPKEIYDHYCVQLNQFASVFYPQENYFIEGVATV